MRFKIYCLMALVCMIGTLSAQEPGNSKADRLFQKAEQHYGRRDYLQAVKQLNSVLAEDPQYINAYLLMGDIYYDLKQPMEAIDAYTRAVRIDSTEFPPAFYIMANLQFEQELFDDAMRNYIVYLGFRPKSQVELMKAERNIKLCEVRKELKSHPVPFNPVNLGEAVNSDGSEYINSVSLDEELMFFTRRDKELAGHERFYIARKMNGKWETAIPMPPPINSPGNQGAMCLSPDGMSLYMTCCSRRDSYGSCDLYVSYRNGSSWTEPENLGEDLNTPSWDSQPCLSADGRTLYFVSTRKGGFGGSDIWKSVLQPDGFWSRAENLGATINTSGEEMAPFIHQDGRTLYFSSNGLPGMGGADLFISRLDMKGNWSAPMNLGFPVNTKNDEINLVINTGGDAAYISSAKTGGFGNTDIYRFELPEEVRPARVSYVKGKVYDKNDLHPLAAAFELIDMQSGSAVVSSQSDPANGAFILSLPVDKDYALNVSCKGYLFFSRNFSISNGMDFNNPLLLDVPMQPVEVGEKVVLRNIFFETDKYELKHESVAELDKLVDFLRKNPGLKIEVSGHTDNAGTDSHNLELSQNRAKAVLEYLVNKGIQEYNLSSKGYGESIPVDTNDTPEGRANNRRTEFKVLAK